LQDHEFQIRHPDSPALLYQFRLGDEKLQVIFFFNYKHYTQHSHSVPHFVSAQCY